MAKYGDVAVRATGLLRTPHTVPLDAWRAAAAEVFPGKRPAQKKACPRGAFLGLCEEGFVVGVPAGSYGAAEHNKGYAVEAVRLLIEDPRVAESGPTALWLRVMNGREKAANHQMDVVLTLWAHDLIVRSRRS
jgi:hypothetical protein